MGEVVEGGIGGEGKAHEPSLNSRLHPPYWLFEAKLPSGTTTLEGPNFLWGG